MTTKINVYREAARLLGDARLATLTDDSAQRYAFDDAWDRTVEYALRAAYWKFALKTITPDVSLVDPVPGFTYVWDLPCDWLRTHAMFIIEGTTARECPFDARHQLEQIHTNVTPINLRYVSNDMADPELWPEHFAGAVAARLAFETAERITGNPAKAEQMFQLWGHKFSSALAPDAIPEWPWLRFELDGSMYRGYRWLLDHANWRFAVKTVELKAIRDLELLTNGDFDADASWTKGTGWTIHSGTAHKAAGTGSDLSQAEAFTAGLAYEITYTVSDYVAGTVTAMFTGGTDVTGTARSANGTYTETLTAVTGNVTALLRASAAADLSIDSVSLKQVTAGLAPSVGYDYAFTKPSDFGRTFHLYRRCGTDWSDIDFRDEDGRLHANHDTIVLRYVSTAGETSTTWSDGFERALLAYCEFEEAKRNPEAPGAVMQARGLAWSETFKNARLKDDMQERPRFNDTGRLVSARRGGSGRYGLGREQGW